MSKENPIISSNFYRFKDGGNLCFLKEVDYDRSTGEFIVPDGDTLQWSLYHFRNPDWYEVVKDPLAHAQALRVGADQGRFGQHVRQWADWIESILEARVQKTT